MNKTIKNHTTKKYYYKTIESLKKHLMAFLMLHNHQRKLKALKFQSPYDKIIEIWKIKPELFRVDTLLKTVGLNTRLISGIPPRSCRSKKRGSQK